MNQKSKLLWVSSFVPYDAVPHAGGKIHNFYIKGINKLDCFDMRLVTFAQIDEKEKIDLNNTSIDYDVIYHHKNGVSHLWWGVLNKLRSINVFNKYGGFISPFMEYKVKKMMRMLKNNGYEPDIIVLQWTQMVLMTKYIKKLFPDAAVVSIEEDVSFLSYMRKYKEQKVFIKRFIRKCRYNKLKKYETLCLNNSKLVVLNNHKDNLLLMENGVCDNTWEWSPYFQTFIDKEYVGKSKDIVFYGAMARPENWQSALWFIQNVWPSIKDDNARFVVVGNKPPVQLTKYADERIIFTGFVEDVAPYFQNSMCMVAPLVMGAGVKIKIIEGFSAGIPILTNDIGIEGIFATDGKEYFHCTEPQDYIDVINSLLSGEIDINKVSKAQKNFIMEKYNFEASLIKFNEKLNELSRRK
ncbi:MAG: glycosyltransferase [Ruminococcus sp.]|nr:glycosyltransferase [Ruminococcus sp.]